MVTIRAPKTTQNKDDFRVLMAGILVAILMTAFKPYVMMYLDPNFADVCDLLESIH